jgi:hypothetical protein
MQFLPRKVQVLLADAGQNGILRGGWQPAAVTVFCEPPQ